MAFKQDTRQQHKEELEQLQRKEENRQFQEELDTIIVRLENEQFQQELDAIIERLDQESQHSSLSEEESSHEFVTEEKPEQKNTIETSTQTFHCRHSSQQEENIQEQETQARNLTKTGKLMQEEHETTGDQKIELEQLQKIEKNKQFQKDLDAIIERLDHESQQPHSSKKKISSHESITEEEPVQLSSLEKKIQTFDNQFIYHHEENTKEQATENQNLEKIEKSMQEENATSSQQASVMQVQKSKKNYYKVLEGESKTEDIINYQIDNLTSKSGIKEIDKLLKEKSKGFSPQGTIWDQKEENLDSVFEHGEPDHLTKNQRVKDQEPLKYPQPGLIMTLRYIGKEIGISFKRYDKTWWENMGGLSIDNKLWKALKLGSVDSLMDEVLRISRKLGWKSHGGDNQLRKICDEVEFKINDTSVKEPSRLVEKSYSIEYVTQDSVNSGTEYLLGFVVKSLKPNSKKFEGNFITLFPIVAMGYNTDGKITLKFFDRANDHLPNGYTVYKGYQNEVRLIYNNQSSESSKKLIEDAMLWLRKQSVSNLEGFMLKKRSRQTIGTVRSLDEKKFKLFELQKSCYNDAILRLDVFPIWRYVKGGQYRFGHRAMGLPTQSNLRIPLKTLIEYYIFAQKPENVLEIRSEIDKVVNINRDDFNRDLKLRVGANYLNIVKTKTFPNKRIIQSFNRLESRKAIISTLKEFAIYQALKDRYIKNNFQSFATNVDEIVEKAMPRIRRVFRVFTQIGGLNESGVLLTLEKQGLISKCYTSRNNLIITWVDVSDDVSDSYRYWISKIYSNYTAVTQRQRETLLQHAIAEGYAFEEIDGDSIFSRKIPEGYDPIPVKYWEINIIKGDDNVSIIPQFLELNYSNSKRNTLVSNATFKSRVKSFIDDHPDKVEVIKDNQLLHKAGLEASIKNNMFKEGGPGLSGTMGDGFVMFDDLLRKYSNDPNVSILGKNFEGLKIIKSDEEAVVRNSLFISSDFKLIDSQGEVVGNGVAKGISNDDTFTRQTIEQLTEEGKRFSLFSEWDNNTAKVFIITFGADEDFNSHVVKSQSSNDLHWESLFHHAIQTKVRNRYYSRFEIDPSAATFNIDNALIDLVTEKIIENSENGYPIYVRQRWQNFVLNLKNDFGEELLETGIPQSQFNEWMSARYKSYLTWFPG